MSAQPLIGCVETELGFVAVAGGPGGLSRSTLFCDTRSAAVAQLAGEPAAPGRAGLIDAALDVLVRYARGEPAAIEEVPVALEQGSELDRRIWLALRRIPRGETRTYGSLALSLSLPVSAARAVGTALGRNPIPIFLPCHRVIGRDGTLRGFAGGLGMKQRLLVLEGVLTAPLAPG